MKIDITKHYQSVFKCLIILILSSCITDKPEVENCTTQESIIECTHDIKNIEEAVKLYKIDKSKKNFWVSDSLFECTLSFLIKKRDNNVAISPQYIQECLGEAKVSHNQYGTWLLYEFYEKKENDTLCTSYYNIICPNDKYFYMECLE